MNVVRIDAYRYALPLVTPQTIARRVCTHREGIVLRVEDDAGICGLGEAAPLPGYSHDSLTDVIEALPYLADRLVQHPLPGGFDQLASAVQRAAAPIVSIPSLQFAIESAIMNLLARRRGIALRYALGAPPCDSVSVNALIAGDTASCGALAAERVRQGYRVIKLKVGGGPVDEDVARVHAVRGAAGPGTRLILDANQSWDWDTAAAFVRGIADAQVEYIEEPLSSAANLADFAASTGCPIALDESLRSLDPEDLQRMSWLRAVVLKPTVLCGIGRVMMFARGAAAAGVRAVVSAAYESGLGIALLASIAAAIGDEEAYAGLDTYACFAADILPERLDMARGRIDLTQCDRLLECIHQKLPEGLERV